MELTLLVNTRLSNARGATSIRRGIRFRMKGMRTLVPLLWMFSRGGSRSEWGVGTRNAFTEGVFLLGEHCHLVAWYLPALLSPSTILRGRVESQID
jgi:hypothetical protein